MLYFGSPAFFVDASDGLMLERGPAIVESALGPYTEMLLAGIALVPPARVPRRRLRAARCTSSALLNYFLIFENLIPLLELDGYFILAEAIEVPDLRERSLQFIQHDVWHKLRTPSADFSKQEFGLGAYAFVGVAFTIFSVWVAIFFWEAIFGGLVVGPLERRDRVPASCCCCWPLFVAGPAIRGLITLVRAAIKRLRALGAEGQVPVRDLVARRGRRDDRRPPGVRRTPRGCPLRPGRPGPTGRLRPGRADLPTG